MYENSKSKFTNLQASQLIIQFIVNLSPKQRTRNGQRSVG